ncbi:uncharacterized protein LOC124274790 [Haliotis rubra]|uniref:uncharacterized protein LOC124274790 n=1 Tax=Haliotis rubra TaxID=36100 RepID=UPI001EE5E42F|nr:uncharacterized protein LOC124274790 [Haliotis rubra]
MEIYVGCQLCFQWSTNTYPPVIALTGNNLTIQANDFLALSEVQIFVCSDGWFGEDCDKQCHCTQNTEVCDKITGQCLRGCAPGYMGPDCQTDGYYGDCTFKCGNSMLPTATRLQASALEVVNQGGKLTNVFNHVRVATMVRTVASSVATVRMVMFASRQMEHVLEDVQQGGLMTHVIRCVKTGGTAAVVRQNVVTARPTESVTKLTESA